MTTQKQKPEKGKVRGSICVTGAAKMMQAKQTMQALGALRQKRGTA